MILATMCLFAVLASPSFAYPLGYDGYGGWGGYDSSFYGPYCPT